MGGLLIFNPITIFTLEVEPRNEAIEDKWTVRLGYKAGDSSSALNLSQLRMFAFFT